MIHTLAVRPAERRILIAGEMLELGDHAAMLHSACGKAAADEGIDLVVGVRGNAQHLAAAACLCGVASIFLPDAPSAGEWLVKNLQPGDVVLVKGSRGVQLERAIEILKTNFAVTENP
jgi:UDP-N-acetylmuramoyl-tripeptide--D-alanyl-D-alanine ligase